MAELLDELRPRAFGIAYRMLGSVSEAEDVVQETLLLDIADGQIRGIRGIVNPDKLRHLGPVSDLMPTPSSRGPL